MKKYAHLFLAICILFTACTHNHGISIKGKIIDSTTALPIANTKSVLTVIETSLNNAPKYNNYDFSTDSTGAFSTLFNAKNGEPLEISFPDSIYTKPVYVIWGYSLNYSNQDKIDVGTIYTKAP